MNKPITKQSFKNLNLIISLLLIVFLTLNTVGFQILATKGYFNTNLTFLFFSFLFIIPGIYLIGIIWFLINTIDYYQGESFKKNRLHLKKIGAQFGFIWLGILFFFSIANIVSLFRFEDGRDSGFLAMIAILYNSLFLIAPIIMLIIGSIADHKIKQRLK
jgi:hypothetical protein